MQFSAAVYLRVGFMYVPDLQSWPVRVEFAKMHGVAMAEHGVVHGVAS
jgi:hypothetical protein